MSQEIEAKAPCQKASEKVKAIGAKYLETQNQEDTYFSHPCRNFKKTDEALRIRKTETVSYMTYKGPQKGQRYKSRQEIEFEVSDGDARTLLESLGFRKAFTIKKTRHVYEYEGLTVCADEVDGLGEYVEVETKKEEDQDKIGKVVSLLGLKGKTTTKTYSELLGL